MSGVKHSRSGYLAWICIILSIHPLFSNIFVDFVMFPSISNIQPRRVSWGVNINWCHCQGEEIEAQLPWENDTAPYFDDRQGLGTFSGCNHLSDDSIGGRTTFGDSTLKFWLSLWDILEEILRNHQLNQCLTLRGLSNQRKYKGTKKWSKNEQEPLDESNQWARFCAING